MDKDVHLIYIFILLVPTTLWAEETLYVLDGHDASIPCGLENIDLPAGSDNLNHITWTLPHMSRIDNIHVNQGNGGHALIIHNTTSLDNGLYTCEVEQIAHKFRLEVGEVLKPLFEGFRIGLPIAQCDQERQMTYQVGIEHAFCGQTEKSCWVDITYVGCFNGELYKVDITPIVSRDLTIEAKRSLEGVLDEVVSDMNASYNTTKHNLVQFLKHSDFPVDVSQYSVYPKWYIDFFFGGSVYEQAREEVAEKLVEALPQQITPRNTGIECAAGFSQYSPLFCIPCLPGQYGKGSSCFACPKGTYQDLYTQSACKPCAGTVSDNKAACSAETLNIDEKSTVSPPLTYKSSTTKQHSTKAFKQGEEKTSTTTVLQGKDNLEQNKEVDVSQNKGNVGENIAVYYNHVTKPAYQKPVQAESIPRGTINYPFEINGEHKDPTKYILIGILIPAIAVFVILLVIRAKRKRREVDPYIKLMNKDNTTKPKKPPQQGHSNPNSASNTGKDDNLLTLFPYIKLDDQNKGGMHERVVREHQRQPKRQGTSLLHDKSSGVKSAGTAVNGRASAQSKGQGRSKSRFGTAGGKPGNREDAVVQLLDGEEMDLFRAPRRQGFVKHY